MLNFKLMLSAFFILMLTANLFAGSIIKIKSVKTVFEDTTITESILYIQDGKIRTETTGKGNRSITIIDPKKGFMINIDPLENSYAFLTAEVISKIIKKIKLQKEEMLKKLPEEQRESMRIILEQQMKNKLKTEYKKIKNERFKSYDCEVYHGFVLDEKLEEMWIAPWEDMKLKDEYINTFKSLEIFFKKMTKSMGVYSEMITSKFDSEMLDIGFPVKTIKYKNDNPTIIETLEKVIETELSPSLFEIPKGMVQKDFFEN